MEVNKDQKEILKNFFYCCLSNFSVKNTEIKECKLNISDIGLDDKIKNSFHSSHIEQALRISNNDIKLAECFFIYSKIIFFLVWLSFFVDNSNCISPKKQEDKLNKFQKIGFPQSFLEFAWNNYRRQRKEVEVFFFYN
jgi:hypothetical protein